jgi:hypothetical protein
MAKLRFTDGVSFETSGKPRIEERFDGSYAVGNGMLIPVSSGDEAEELPKKNSPHGCALPKNASFTDLVTKNPARTCHTSGRSPIIGVIACICVQICR